MLVIPSALIEVANVKNNQTTCFFTLGSQLFGLTCHQNLLSASGGSWQMSEGPLVGFDDLIGLSQPK